MLLSKLSEKVLTFLVFSSIIVQIPYWIGDYFTLIKSYLSSGEILLFFGALLTFIGTTFLGVVALRQNKEATTISEKLLEIEKSKIKPLLEIEVFDNISLGKGNTLSHNNYKDAYHYSFIEKNNCRVKYLSLISLKIINIGKARISKINVKELIFKIDDVYCLICDNVISPRGNTPIYNNESRILEILAVSSVKPYFEFKLPQLGEPHYNIHKISIKIIFDYISEFEENYSRECVKISDSMVKEL